MPPEAWCVAGGDELGALGAGEAVGAGARVGDGAGAGLAVSVPDPDGWLATGVAATGRDAGLVATCGDDAAWVAGAARTTGAARATVTACGAAWWRAARRGRRCGLGATWRLAATLRLASCAGARVGTRLCTLGASAAGGGVAAATGPAEPPD